MTEETIRPTDQWENLNKELNRNQNLIIILFTLIFLSITLNIIQYEKDPLVVVLKDDERLVFKSIRTSLNVSELDLETTIDNFVRNRYQWKSFKPKLILRNIKNLATKDFIKKLSKELGKKSYENKEGAQISQWIAGLKVNVSKDSISANFHRVLEINGNPIANPEFIKFNIVDGSKTEKNPLGLYINGVIEHVQ